jgi:nitrite reductase/ring-hydroxylating ferredoxin subunit
MAKPIRLIAVAELGASGVATVDTPHGKLAVGISDGEPFAVSDRCRHLFASLGEGRVADDGCLECPRHRARYDVRTGAMTRGPQGMAFLAAREAIRLGASAAAPLARYPVEERDGVLYLAPGS